MAATRLTKARATAMKRAKPVTRNATRARRSRVADAIGETPGTNTSKKCQVAANVTPTKATRTLYDTELVNILKVSGSEEIDRRERDAIHVLGFKIRFNIRSLTTVQGLNWTYAVIAAKNSSATAPTATGFFRDYSAQRSIDFGTTLNGIQFAKYPVNEDLYRVLHKGTFFLEPAGLTGANTAVDEYVKLDRQITYNSSTGNPNTRMWVVYWCDIHTAVAGNAPVAGAAYVVENHLTYFKEPQASRAMQIN